MLMFARNLFMSTNELKSGIWNKSAGFQLEKSIGIIGIGHIVRAGDSKVLLIVEFLQMM